MSTTTPRPGRSGALATAGPTVAFLALLMSMALPAAAQGTTPAPSNGPQTATLTDFRGKTMEVPVGTEHVVFLVENAMNTFYALGGAEHISGIGDIWQPGFKEGFFRAVDADYDTTPRVSTADGAVDLEALAAAKPDLVVLWSADIDDKDTTAIERGLGVPVYGVFLDAFEDLEKLTADMAAILGDPARAEAVTAQVAESMAAITAVSGAIPAEERPTVYWMWGDVFGTAGLESTADELISAAGGTNVLATWEDEARTTEHPVLSMETIAALDPEVIYLWFNPEIDPADIIAGREAGGVDFSAWSGLAAVRDGRVYELDDPFLYDFMTGRQPIATLKIAKDINPEAFAGVDLPSEVDAFFRQMYGVSYPDFAPAGLG
jgi:iron complex transport system substrate-binding protein